VLKRAGIVVGVVASGMLAMTPLASAEVAAPAQVSNTCSMSQSGPVILQNISGSLLGLGLIIPVTAQTQAGNCTLVNFSNLINNNSGNTTTNTIRTRIQNSFNRTIGR
jgi:hypothetical protein